MVYHRASGQVGPANHNEPEIPAADVSGNGSRTRNAAQLGSEFPVAALNDEVLLARVVDGDTDSLYELMSRHHATVTAIASAILRDVHRAEDAAQKTWIAVWQNAAKFNRAIGKARNWIGQVARNEGYMIARWHRSRPSETLDRVASPVLCIGPDESLEWREVKWVLRRALRTLDRPSRRLVLLRFRKGATFAELAARGGVAISTVYERITDVIERLRRAYPEQNR